MALAESEKLVNVSRVSKLKILVIARITATNSAMNVEEQRGKVWDRKIAAVPIPTSLLETSA